MRDIAEKRSGGVERLNSVVIGYDVSDRDVKREGLGGLETRGKEGRKTTMEDRS